ncbi:MAG TPA: hypothetical protein VML50_06360 [Anaeromyxobacter sp.]|nr:hypothetical protein [Anaeromyxobacter sp.]
MRSKALRLAALAAALAPADAVRLLGRVPDPEAAREAGRLAPLPRAARLAALAAAASGEGSAPGPRFPGERPRVAAALARAVDPAPGSTAEVHPLLRRLARERVS